MKIKFLFVTATLLLAVLFFTPGVAQGVTIDELLAQINALQAQILQFQAQMAGQNTGTPTTPTVPVSTDAWCYTFNTNLGVGSSGDDVYNLITALKNEGLGDALFSHGGTGLPSVLTEAVASSVTAFQEKYAFEVLAPYRLTSGTGYVGRSTRAKLNSLYGCPVPVDPVVTLRANGRENVLEIVENTSVTFSWTSKNAVSCSSSGGYSNWAQLLRRTSGSVELYNPVNISRTFTITCVGTNGVSTSDSVRVNVSEYCTSDWNCEEWSNCLNNWQMRTCRDQNSCAIETNRPESTQICTPSKPTWCYTFNTNLGIGSSGPEVDQLATALQKEGLFSTARTYSNYDQSLASAVSAFQEKYASEVLAPYRLNNGTGYVGRSTRAKLNSLYGCSNLPVTQPSITVTSPNGGEFNAGDTVNILWTSVGIISSDYSVYLYGSRLSGGNKYIGSGSAPNGSFSWVIGTDIPSGFGYTVRVVGPAISGGSGEFTIVAPVAQTCTDSDGGKVYQEKGTTSGLNGSYIDYCYAGNTSSTCYYCSVNSGVGLKEYYCRDNGYVTEVNYTCPNGCENGACKPEISQPSITVTSPNGGESLTVGQKYNITWDSTGLLSTDKINLWLKDVSTSSAWMTTVNLLGNVNSYNWTVPSLPGTKYQLEASAYRNGSSLDIDTSDNYFSIVEPSSQLSITIIAPNGGETLTVGQKVNITWNSSGILPTDRIKIFVKESLSPFTTATFHLMAENLSGDTNSYSWIIPEDFSTGNNLFQISIYAYKTGRILQDFSDTSFSIVAPTAANQSPIISNISGPTELDKDQNGTWVVNATDPDGDPLTYRVIWGDTPVSQTYYNAHIFNHSFTMGASYQDPTRYQNVFYVKDSHGNETRKDVYVSVSRTSSNLITTSSATLIGGQSSYAPGEIIKFSLKGVASDGSIPGPETGFNVQWRLKDQNQNTVQIGGRYQAGNAIFNRSTNNWDITMTAPVDSSQEYIASAGFYCSTSIYGKCDAENNPASIKKTFTFRVSPSAPPSITVTSPNGGEFNAGDTVNILWTSVGITSSDYGVYLYGSRLSGGNKYIGSGSAPNGSFSWVIGTDIPSGAGYTVRVVGPAISGGSGEFTIVAPVAQTCTDSDSGFDYYERGYTSDSDPTASNIWDTCNGSYVIERRCYLNSGISTSFLCPYGCENGACKQAPVAQPSITVTSPNGGESWVRGSSYNITWSTTGLTTIEKVYITFSKYMGATNLQGRSTIAYNIPATQGFYNWSIPSNFPIDEGLLYKVTVYTLYQRQIDSSDNFFRIGSAFQPTGYCATLQNRIAGSWYKFCGETGYDAVADIDKNKQIHTSDWSLYSANNTNQTWCQEKLEDTTSPCEPVISQSSLFSISDALASVSQRIRELLGF